jgi:hypothetical protein
MNKQGKLNHFYQLFPRGLMKSSVKSFVGWDFPQWAMLRTLSTWLLAIGECVS